MTESRCEIRPLDDDELRKACAEAARGPGRSRPVSALIDGLLFQFSDSSLLGERSEIIGPYCQTCRKALFPVTYTEWSTADRGEASSLTSCPHCGERLTSGTSLRELQDVARLALNDRLKVAGIDREERESP